MAVSVVVVDTRRASTTAPNSMLQQSRYRDVRNMRPPTLYPAVGVLAPSALQRSSVDQSIDQLLHRFVAEIGGHWAYCPMRLFRRDNSSLAQCRRSKTDPSGDAFVVAPRSAVS